MRKSSITLSHVLPRALAVLASAGVLCAVVTARSAPPDDPATPADVVSAVPSAFVGQAPSASASVEVPLPSLRGVDIPEGLTDMPQGKEWDTARKVRLSRHDSVPCLAKVLREWVRLSCDVPGATHFAGDPAFVKIVAPRFALWGAQAQDKETSEGTTIFVQLRRGDAQMFHLHTGSSVGGYGSSISSSGAGAGNAPILSVAWREGQRDPVVLVSEPGE